MYTIGNFIKRFLVFLFIMSTTVPAFSQIKQAKVPEELKSILRKDHPRIFFNSESFPAIKVRALNEEAKVFNDMKMRADQLDPDKAQLRDYGIPAAEAAFVYLVTGDDTYLVKTKKLLGRFHICEDKVQIVFEHPDFEYSCNPEFSHLWKHSERAYLANWRYHVDNISSIST